MLVCMIPALHLEPGFCHAHKDQDNWFVPRSEVYCDPENTGKKIGHSNFCNIYKGSFLIDISVAKQILSLKNGMKKDKHIKDLMKGVGGSGCQFTGVHTKDTFCIFNQSIPPSPRYAQHGPNPP